MKLIIANEQISTDISECVGMITWSGEYNNCARALDFTVACSETDKNYPIVDCEIMNAVNFIPDSSSVFKGFVWDREKQTGENSYSLTAFDKGFYLKKITVSRNFCGTTPESMTRRLCDDYGISVGSLAKTGYIMTRNFFNKNLYQIIMTGYTLASKKTGKNYQMIFTGDNLNVIERGSGEKINLEPGNNLMSLSISESAENVVTRVKIYDKDNNFVRNIENTSAKRIYGLIQQCVKQSEGDNGTNTANQILQEGVLQQKIVVNNLGDLGCTTGRSVTIKEPYTGVHGIFFIDSDIHTWKNGQYFNKLTLNFKGIMDKIEVGNLPEKYQ